jgi:hypothetical protein
VGAVDNTVTGRQVGINLVNPDNLTVTGNKATATVGIGDGISATEASDDSVMAGDDVRTSFEPDCVEDPSRR